MPSKIRTIKRALISVSDKTGIVEFASALASMDIEILSTGGTASLLRQQGLTVKDVSEHTGHPEIMDGRVKTLHPKIHGGILGRRDIDANVMQKHEIAPIDLVVVNLYPFEETVSKSDCSFDDAIENIDIGGPAMVRASAKNFNDVTIVVDPSHYSTILDELNSEAQGVSYSTRFSLAVNAFEHTARYDGMIASHFGSLLNEVGADPSKESEITPSVFPRTINHQFLKKQDLRYGENAHQEAAFYVEHNIQEASVSTATQLQGKELSFNNIADTDAALECVKEFAEPACVIVKHANPCGVAIGTDISDAYEKAFKTDPTSAFGGIIAFNRELDEKTAKAIVEKQFVEVIIAPKVTSAAKEAVSAKKECETT